jgi:hypothetical protein
MFVTVELLYGTPVDERKEKRMMVNNIKIYYISAGRGYNDRS